MEKNKYCAAQGGGCYFEDVRIFYNNIEKLCKKNAYNLVLHKHLGDVFYAIASKPFFEAQYNAPLHFIVRPQHEFLMKMFGVKNYSVYDLKKVESDILKQTFPYMPYARHASHKFDVLCKDIFATLPIKGVPFIVDSERNNFGMFDNYWCLIWMTNMGLGQDFRFFLPQHNLELSPAAAKKIAKIAPLDKIILIAPEAATFAEFGPEFWNVIADKMHKLGYKIIVNSKKYKINNGICAFDLGLSLQDVVALGLNCAYVFALRSGLCDVLVGCGNRLYAFYPAQGRREMYSLKEPFATDTGVNEIQIYDWKIDKVICENIDFTAELQKYINGLHRNYYKESLKRIFSFRKHRATHAFWRNLMRDLAGVSKAFPENNTKNPAPVRNVNLKPLYAKQINKYVWGREKKYSWLGGILTLRKDSLGAQRMRFCGITFYSKRNVNGFRTTRVFWIPIHTKNLKKELLDRILRNIDDKYDDIYISRHNIGETYVYLTHLQNWIKKNGSKKPLLLVWRKKDIPLYQMFVNKNIALKYIDISQQDLHGKFTEECIEYKGKRIFCPTPDILANILEKRKEIPTWTFYDHICKDFAMDAKDKLPKPVVSEKVKNMVKLKIKEYFKRPFVIIIPNANSLRQMPVEFWNIIIHKLHVMGYDVFVNNHRTESDNRVGLNLSETVTFDCNLAEMYELSRNSAGVITLASGLAVFLTATGNKMDLIYTKAYILDKNPGESMKDMYSVYNLPGVNDKKVKEYDAELYSPDELAEIILLRYKKK